jgi:hypothetical protein
MRINEEDIMKKYKKICDHCKKVFDTNINEQKFCSISCRTKKHFEEHGIIKNYPIKKCLFCGKEFAPKCMYVFERDNWTCKECGNRKNEIISLHGHHIIPLYKGGKDSVDNIITLCEKCHKKRHGVV